MDGDRVEIEWTTPWSQRRRDWVRADQVRRRWPEETADTGEASGRGRD